MADSRNPDDFLGEAKPAPRTKAAPEDAPRSSAGASKKFEDFSEGLRQLIHSGTRPDGTSYPTRSEALYAACCGMVREGADDKSILAIITDPAHAISASVVEKKDRRYARRQITRARAAASDPDLSEMNWRYAIIEQPKPHVVFREDAKDMGSRVVRHSFDDFKKFTTAALRR